MSDTSIDGPASNVSGSPAQVPVTSGNPAQFYDGDREPWSGVLGFAATMAILIGVLHAIAGLTALFNDDHFVVADQELIVSVDYSAWGWAHLVIGALAIATGAGIIKRQRWARAVGVVFAVLSVIVNLGFLNAQPVWSAVVIAFDLVLIWALTVHGDVVSGRGTKPRWSSPYGPT